ncbi:MAG: thiolase family protein [Planctomycetes bacterium]|nr:thiolase family protein [Planctomycetota bacterium]
MASREFPQIVIIGAARTPVGVKCGTLREFSPEDLAVFACEEAIRRSGIDRSRVDAVVGANVYQFTAPGMQDIYFPRNVALRCRLDIETPALMVQRICGSGLQTVINGVQQIALPSSMDDAEVVLCFGSETMSRSPRILRSKRLKGSFWEFEERGELEDTLLLGLNHDLVNTTMMGTANEYGARMGITRQDCDDFAEQSHARARAAYRESHFNGGDALKGIFAVDARDLCGTPVHLARDECVRKTTREALSKLSAITPDGLVTAGNASEISDGAAALVLADRARAEALGLPTRFEVAGYGVVGVDPKVMGRGPVPAIAKALVQARIEQKDVGLWEINEAFAAQVLGVQKEANLNPAITNVNGGAIAIGHPLAATGGRMLVDLMYEMERRGVRYGCASACIGGGQGVAVIIKNTDGS